jgi:diguanylate cyclase (GGDEF)-like protein/PAS domain S-box-containing protein
VATATQEDARTSRSAKTSRSALLAIVAGGNLFGTAAVLAVWWFGEHDLIDGPPYWAFMSMILASIACDGAVRIWYGRRPGSRLREQVRIVVAASATTVIIYPTGWGSLLGIAYALCAVQILAQLRTVDWRLVLGRCGVGVTAGEVAVGAGVAPTMVTIARSHVIAATGLLLLAVVLWIVSGILAARDAVELEVRERGQRLAHDASTDSLTQLPNRAAFTEALERSCAAREPAILAFVDLDNFKDINDSFGHHVGDDVLVEVAARLLRVVRAGDMIARFGGDEFVILAKSSRGAADAVEIAERVYAVLAEPWPIIAPNMISASVGVVDDHDGTSSPDDLLSRADKAMYARKHGMSATGPMTAMTSRALAHHRLAMDGMHGSFVVLQAIRRDDEIVDFEIVEANAIIRSAFEPLCGQVVGARLSKLNAAVDNTAVIPLYERALSTGERVNAELCLAQPDGRTVWRNVDVVSVDHDVVAVVAHDISAEVEARESLERRVRFAGLIARSSDLGCVVDAAGKIVYAPSSDAAFLGYTSDDLGPPLSRVAPGDRDEASAWFEEVRSLPSGTEARSVALQFVARDGSAHTCDVTAQNRSDDASIGGIVLSVHDVSALVAAEARLAAVVDAIADVIVICNEKGDIMWVSGAVRDALDIDPDDLVGVSAFDLVHPDDHANVVARLLNFVAETDGIAPPIELRLRLQRADGTYRWFDCRSKNQLDDPSIHGLVISLRDSTDRRAAETALRTSGHALRIAATRDELTGLANRRALRDRAPDAIEQVCRTDDVVGMVFVDLDRFKLVNDGLGHDAGDQLLVLVAERIAAAVRVQDVVARLGSDEFVVLCPSASDLDAIRAVALRVLDALAAPFAIRGNEVVVGASIGVSVGTGSETPLELLRAADTAMYRAKDDGNTPIKVFDARMQQHAARRLDLESALRQATERGELFAYYQPIVDLQREQVAHFEALIRWDRPGVGLVRPDAFIPVAEETGIIMEIGMWVLCCAAADCARWQSVAPGVGVSVNVSVRQFESGDLVSSVQQALLRTGLAPELLTVEITETVMLDHTDRNAAIMRRIRDLGVHISLDDFGSGFSSLTYLRLLPIDSLKIDRSFLQSFGSAWRDDAMLRAIVNLGTTYDLVVVAEGIDTEAKLAAVRAVGCRYGQGFLFSKPMPIGEALAYLGLEQGSSLRAQ